MISVVIPVLNEANSIGPCLRQFNDQPETHDIVVVDGGSRDNTLDVVRTFPKVKCLSGLGSGRGRQMNQGARFAKGDILLFLHADTLLPSGGLAMIRSVMDKERGNLAGSFALRFDRQSPLLRLYAWLSRINHVLFTYGDQGLFMRRDTFEQVGGFPEIPLMEDVAMQKRLRKTGRFVKLGHPVVTSARRFVSKGILWQQCINIALVALYQAGVSPYRLRRFYN